MTGTLIYLHGFLSSGQSKKGAILREACRRYGWKCQTPDINMGPKAVSEKLQKLYEECCEGGPVVWVGGSLGGFYAAWIAHKTDTRAVLVNPAVTPWNIVERYVGEQQIYGGERTLTVRPEFAQELKELNVEAFEDPSKILLVLTTGDEVLDWRQSVCKYEQLPSLVIDGGDHMVSNFDEYVDSVMRFLID